MRRGFTLIELLTIVAIIAIMVTASVSSVTSGQGAARVRGATRDLFATIRHARSMALVSQQPSIITYSTKRVDDEPCATVDIVTAKMFSSEGVKEATTLSGEKVRLDGEDEAEVSEPKVRKGEKGKGAPAADGASSGGQTVEEVLFAPISTDVVRGMRLKVVKEGDELDGVDAGRAKPKISVFSNVDYLVGRLRSARAEAAKKADGDAASGAGGQGEDEPVSVVWEVNGRTEPHKVWIYPDGKRYDEGLCIAIDRFGAAKVLGAGEDG